MIVWVADYFAADGYVGGAELTSRAIMDACPDPIVRRSTRELSEADVERYDGATWVVENMLGVFTAPPPQEALSRVFATQRFFKIEYDYNWCRARSPLAHRVGLGSPCDCASNGPPGLLRLYRVLQERVQHVFFMSVNQLAVYRQHLGPAMTRRTSVLSSCFSIDTLERIAALGRTPKGHRWLIVSGRDEPQDFWRKGAANGVGLARELGLPYAVAGGLPYDELLAEMARSRGLVLLPNNLDPCPRTAIEARLMGRAVILNDNVQHRDERWFKDATPEAVVDYIRGRPAYFWRVVRS